MQPTIGTGGDTRQEMAAKSPQMPAAPAGNFGNARLTVIYTGAIIKIVELMIQFVKFMELTEAQ